MACFLKIETTPDVVKIEWNIKLLSFRSKKIHHSFLNFCSLCIVTYTGYNTCRATCTEKKFIVLRLLSEAAKLIWGLPGVLFTWCSPWNRTDVWPKGLLFSPVVLKIQGKSHFLVYNSKCFITETWVLLLSISMLLFYVTLRWNK